MLAKFRISRTTFFFKMFTWLYICWRRRRGTGGGALSNTFVRPTSSCSSFCLISITFLDSQATALCLLGGHLHLTFSSSLSGHFQRSLVNGIVSPCVHYCYPKQVVNRLETNFTLTKVRVQLTLMWLCNLWKQYLYLGWTELMLNCE